MAKFEFPRNPGTDRGSPFEDAEGNNPFSDGTSPPAETSHDNLFAAPASGEPRPYTPGDYETALVANSRGALVLGIIGAGMSAMGVIGVVLGIAGVGTWLVPLFYALPVQFAALAVAIPAWMIAGRDLRAMKAGAMKAEGRRQSRFALVLGIAGTVLGAIPVVLYFGILIYFTFLA